MCGGELVFTSSLLTSSSSPPHTEILSVLLVYYYLYLSFCRADLSTPSYTFSYLRHYAALTFPPLFVSGHILNTPYEPLTFFTSRSHTWHPTLDIDFSGHFFHLTFQVINLFHLTFLKDRD